MQTCPDNNSHSIDVSKTNIIETDLDSKKTDALGRQEIYVLSANPEFQAQWTSISDHIDVATPTNNIRGGGEMAIWDTSSDNNVMYPASSTLGTNPSPSKSEYSGYHQNALEHHIFKGQRQISSGWKRKRLRFLFKDIVNIREGFIKFKNAVHGKVIVDSFIFLRNIGLDPLQQSCSPYNPSLAHDDTTNPVGWVLTGYVSGISLEGEGSEIFNSEKSSSDLTFFASGVPIMELWVEITYDPSALGTPCTGSARAFIFRKNTVDNGYEM